MKWHLLKDVVILIALTWTSPIIYLCEKTHCTPIDMCKYYVSTIFNMYDISEQNVLVKHFTIYAFCMKINLIKTKNKNKPLRSEFQVWKALAIGAFLGLQCSADTEVFLPLKCLHPCSLTCHKALLVEQEDIYPNVGEMEFYSRLKLFLSRKR